MGRKVSDPRESRKLSRNLLENRNRYKLGKSLPIGLGHRESLGRKDYLCDINRCIDQVLDPSFDVSAEGVIVQVCRPAQVRKLPPIRKLHVQKIDNQAVDLSPLARKNIA